MKSKFLSAHFATAFLLALCSVSEASESSNDSDTGPGNILSQPSSVTTADAAKLSEPQRSQEVEAQNNRMKTLEGSSSRWSGQFNLTYSGSSISNPLSGEVPNPGHQVPPPLATLSGTMSGRYRLGKSTTVGLGTGLTTQTPFQGPKNTTVADPYIDIAHSYTIGPFHSRADLQTTLWTNNQYHDQFGYRFGVTALNELFYQFSFGLTTGLALQFDYNFFAGGSYDVSQQIAYDLYADPYFEFRLSKRLNLRSVLGIASLHSNDLTGVLSVVHPNVYQTLGVGVAVADAVFVYPYVQFFPFSGNISTQSTLVGLNAIVNIL